MIEEGFKKLAVYQLAHQLAVEIHALSLTLAKHELYEEGGQIRRSSKSVSSQIVEGYCLRKYKKDFLLYLSRAYASAEETIEHLELLYETRSLANEDEYRRLRVEYEKLCAMIFRFIQSVSKEHELPSYLKERSETYETEPE